MKTAETPIKDLWIIYPDVFPDDRGYFFESFNRIKYNDVGIIQEFVQDNISKSVKNTIRGLHYQVGEYAQGKLVQVLDGKVLDVAVDIRFGSLTFGKYVSVELSSENQKQFWIPPGFAHGFSVLSKYAVFHYKCTSFYSRKDERSIRYDDPTLNIDWKVENPIVSNKDLENNLFSSINEDFIFNN